jgi:hypothetical protein
MLLSRFECRMFYAIYQFMTCLLTLLRSSTVLGIGTKMEVNGHLHVSAAFPSGKEMHEPIRKQTGLAPEAGWTLWREERSLSPTQN